MRLTVGVMAIALAAAGPAVVRAAPMTLPGLSYEVLKSGPASGISPTRADTITVRYVGHLADGNVFNASADAGLGAATFPLMALIPGWVAALQMMKPGDKWRLTLPPYLGYGHRGKPEHGVPPDATLIFEVELVSIAPASPAPAESAK